MTQETHSAAAASESYRRRLTYPARRLGRMSIDNSVGMLPFLEARNRILRRSAARCVERIEDDEVARYAGSSAAAPSAKVVTVVATYKRPQLVVGAVESALAQTEEDHVVVVVSDGEDAPDLPAHDRLVLVPLSRHIGVLGAVRNVGIRISRSPHIAFLDDDNRWLPSHLEDCLTVLDEGETFVYSGINRVLPNGVQYDQLGVPFDRNRLRNENYIDANAMVVRRSSKTLFSRIPRPRGLLPPEDWEFAWRLTSSGARLVERPSVQYLINPESNFYPDFYEHALAVTHSQDGKQSFSD